MGVVGSFSDQRFKYMNCEGSSMCLRILDAGPFIAEYGKLWPKSGLPVCK